MEFITTLWMPILVASVLVFLTSWVMHTLLPVHKGDFANLPNEDAFMAASRDAGVSPGQYVFPGGEIMGDEWKAKAAEGPVGIMFIGGAGGVNLGKQLGQHFAYCLVVSIFVAYLANSVVGGGSEYLHVFRVAGTAAFLAYAMAHVSHAVWWFHSWGSTFRYVLDGLVYSVMTAGAFGWLWPA